MHKKVITAILFLIFAIESKSQVGFEINLRSFKTLDSSKYANVFSFLSRYNKLEVGDTIIIKYDFNKESCWNALDLKDDEYIFQIIKQKRNYITVYSTNRLKLIVFQLHEKGKKFNKVISRDLDIKEDSSNYLFKTLIKRRTKCGSSIIILPDGRYFVNTSDPHFELLSFELKNGH